MVEVVVDGAELESQFLDDLFIAIRDKLPVNTWVPITKDHQRVIAGVKHIIDCRSYGENFDIALHDNMTHFKKISGIQPRYNTADPVSSFSASYWTEQDALKLTNDKRAYEKAIRAEQTQHNKELKKRRRR